MTADPRIVEDASLIDEITYNEFSIGRSRR